MKRKTLNAALLAAGLALHSLCASAAGRADLTGLGTLGGTFSAGYGINASGQVVGEAMTAGEQQLRAFLATGGVMQDLGTLGGTHSVALAVSANGSVVGWAIDAAEIPHAFLYTSGTMQDLGTLGGSYSTASGINASDQVVGMAHTAAGADRAFLHNAGTMFDLNRVASAGWVLTSGAAINDHAQIAGTGYYNGDAQAFRLTLHPDWQGGNGSWSDASRWGFAGMGSFGITPGAPHDVVIRPTTSATVQGPGDASVRTLVVSAPDGHFATLELSGGSIDTQYGSTLGANGTLAGGGRLGGAITIQVGGRVRVRDFETMQLAGSVSNAGRIDVQAAFGRAGLDVGGEMVSPAGSEINLLNADLYLRGGVKNGGRISIAGLTTVGGGVNNAGGQVNVSGVASHAIFWDDFVNNGSVNVTGGSTATFFGMVNGRGDFGGAGTKNFAGGYAPGNSAAQVSLDGSVNFEGGALEMELGGTQAGSEHDKLVLAGPVSLAGATQLAVVWWNGWAGQAGDSYDLFDWNGGISGSFAGISLPTLASGLVWDSTQLYGTGELSITAVPEPESWALLLAGLAAVGYLVRRRSGASAGRG